MTTLLHAEEKPCMKDVLVIGSNNLNINTQGRSFMKDMLVARLSAGSVSAFEKIMRRYSGYVLAVIRNHSRGALSYEDMEELVSDTFVAVWKQRTQLDPSRPLMPYLAVTARNRTINALRRLKITVSLEDSDVYDPGIEQSLEQRAAVSEMLEAVSQLSDKQRNVFTRFYCYGETLAEISGGLKISLSDAKTTLMRAREAVRRILSERGYDHV